MVSLLLAHPLTEPGGLDLPPVFLAVVVLALMVLGVRLLPLGPPLQANDATTIAVAGPLRRSTGVRAERADTAMPAWERALRAVVVALLLLAVYAGRVGRDSQVGNIAPSLIIGVGWPVVLLLQVAAVDVWRRINPFDTLARALDALAGRRASDEPASRWSPSLLYVLPAAAFWVWYFAAFRSALEPRVVGFSLAAYTIATLSMCLLVGRRTWLANGEFFTVFFTVVADVRSGRSTPPAPHGLALLVAVVAGGLSFATLRFSQLWLRQLQDMGLNPISRTSVLVGLVVCCVLSVLGVRAAEAYSRRSGAPAGTVVLSLVPVAAGIALALSMVRDRLFNAVQILIARASNPLGGDADVFGTATWVVRPELLGEHGTVVVQLLVLLAVSIAGARFARRHAPDAATPAILAVGAYTALGVLAVTAV